MNINRQQGRIMYGGPTTRAIGTFNLGAVHDVFQPIMQGTPTELIHQNPANAGRISKLLHDAIANVNLNQRP